MNTGWGMAFTNYNILFFVDEKTQGKDRENTGNFVLIRAWQPCDRTRWSYPWNSDQNSARLWWGWGLGGDGGGGVLSWDL